MSKVLTKPDFVSIGPTKTGSTWLHGNLSLHPEIWLPPAKECRYDWGSGYRTDQALSTLANLKRRVVGNYYLRWRKKYANRRIREYLSGDTQLTWQHLAWDIRYMSFRRTPNWYSSLFKEGFVSGDIDGTYTRYTDEQVAALKSHVPDVRILICMRNPIHRLWSVVRMRLLHMQKLPADSIDDDTIKREVDKINRDYPDYLTLIERWHRHFPSDQVHLSYFEDLQNDPQRHFNSICQFLEISTDYPQAIKDNLSNVVFKGKSVDIPEPVERYLAEVTIDSIRRLAAKYNTRPVRDWIENAERIIR